MSLSGIIPLLTRDTWFAAFQAFGRTSARFTRVGDRRLPVAARAARTCRAGASSRPPDRHRHQSPGLGRGDWRALMPAYLDQQPLVWPAIETLPYEQLPVDRTTSARRVEILASLLDGTANVVVTPASGLSQLVSSPERSNESGSHWPPDNGCGWIMFISMHWSRDTICVPMVTEPGQISQRGGIVDIFPPRPITPFASTCSATRSSPSAVSILSHSVRSSAWTQSICFRRLEISLAHAQRAAADLRGLDTVAPFRPEVEEEWQRLLREWSTETSKRASSCWRHICLEMAGSILDYLPEDHLLVFVEPSSVRSVDRAVGSAVGGACAKRWRALASFRPDFADLSQLVEHLGATCVHSAASLRQHPDRLDAIGCTSRSAKCRCSPLR